MVVAMVVNNVFDALGKAGGGAEDKSDWRRPTHIPTMPGAILPTRAR